MVWKHKSIFIWIVASTFNLAIIIYCNKLCSSLKKHMIIWLGDEKQPFNDEFPDPIGSM